MGDGSCNAEKGHQIKMKSAGRHLLKRRKEHPDGGLHNGKAYLFV